MGASKGCLGVVEALDLCFFWGGKGGGGGEGMWFEGGKRKKNWGGGRGICLSRNGDGGEGMGMEGTRSEFTDIRCFVLRYHQVHLAIAIYTYLVLGSH